VLPDIFIPPYYITFPFARCITLYFPATYFDHYCHPEGRQEDPEGDKHLGGKRNYINKRYKINECVMMR
jgi:hypothetical protein